MTVAILADGETPVGPAAEAYHQADACVACDGAWRRARALGRAPEFVVGDGDSLSSAEKSQLGARFIGCAEQETNDLEKAFRFVRAHYPESRIVIVGAGGGREDHLLGNIFRLIPFVETGADVRLFTNAGYFDVVRNVGSFACRPGESVSIFAPTPGTQVRSSGLEWPLDGVDIASLFAATLNRTTESSFTLWTTASILVYRVWLKGVGNENCAV